MIIKDLIKNYAEKMGGGWPMRVGMLKNFFTSCRELIIRPNIESDFTVDCF